MTTRRLCSLVSIPPCLFVLLLYTLQLHEALAANVSLRAEKGQRFVRGDANNGMRKAARGGPRRQLLPKRFLQSDMGVEPLAGGYGGAGALNMNQEIPDMRPQSIPDGTATPPGSQEPVLATSPPSATITPPPTTPPSSTIPPSTLPPSTLPPSTLSLIATFVPGLLSVMEGELLMSKGLTSQLIATSGMPVQYADGTLSGINFHAWPDGAGTFIDMRPSNPNGWIYVSNSEHEQGGVGAITFNSQGQIIDYRMILTGTRYSKISMCWVASMYPTRTLFGLFPRLFFVTQYCFLAFATTLLNHQQTAMAAKLPLDTGSARRKM
jgi:hypothetical protein